MSASSKLDDIEKLYADINQDMSFDFGSDEEPENVVEKPPPREANSSLMGTNRLSINEKIDEIEKMQLDFSLSGSESETEVDQKQPSEQVDELPELKESINNAEEASKTSNSQQKDPKNISEVTDSEHNDLGHNKEEVQGSSNLAPEITPKPTEEKPNSSRSIPSLTELVVPAPLELPTTPQIEKSIKSHHQQQPLFRLENLVVVAPLELPKPVKTISPIKKSANIPPKTAKPAPSLCDLVVPAPLELPTIRPPSLQELVVPAPLEIPRAISNSNKIVENPVVSDSGIRFNFNLEDLVLNAPLELPRPVKPCNLDELKAEIEKSRKEIQEFDNKQAEQMRLFGKSLKSNKHSSDQHDTPSKQVSKDFSGKNESIELSPRLPTPEQTDDFPTKVVESSSPPPTESKLELDPQPEPQPEPKSAPSVPSPKSSTTKDDSQTVYLYTSMASGVRGTMKRFNMATTILKSYEIDFVPVEITLDDKARRLWKFQGAQKNKVLPAVVRDGDIKCDFNELVEANEIEDVEETIFDGL